MLKIPRLISEGCVLQHGIKVRIWGTDTPGRRITVKFQGQNRTGLADAGGRWEVFFQNLAAGGPFPMEIADDERERIRLSGIYVGEVWVCSGQSNMELPMERVKDKYPEEFSAAQYPAVHYFKVEEGYEFGEPRTDYQSGEWLECTSKNLASVSAVSYFYGKYLYQDLGVPIGIINASMGGSRIEAWMSGETLAEKVQLLKEAQRYKGKDAVHNFVTEQEKEMTDWHNGIEEHDPQEDGWKDITLPGTLEEAGLSDFCGSILLRSQFMVPASLAGKSCWLWLGTLVDSDQTYINGKKVGETGYEYPPRKYMVPEGFLQSGENEICIHLICKNGRGRMTPGKELALFWEEDEVALSGGWQYQILCRCKEAPEMDFLCRKATGLYNAMLAPCQKYTVRGVFWYQGESNTARPDEYERLLKDLILSWREQWRQERLPFIIAQLPDFAIDLPEESSGWPEIREAQSRVKRLGDVAVTVNLDLGEDQDLHPLDKEGVACRASLAARRMVYGEDICADGPVPMNWSVEDGLVKILFDTNDQSGLMTMDAERPEEFYLAGEDRRFYPADCELQGNTVLLKNDDVPAPAAVRYAYSNAPRRGLLCNESGLPAPPFRTDNWEEKVKYGCRLFNDGWEFTKQPLSVTTEELQNCTEAFVPVSLPHDWLIYQGRNLYEDGCGWYRKPFFWKKDKDQCLLLRFEGIYMDSTVYINHREVSQWKNGYTTFEVDITPYLEDGDNEILVRVIFQAPNSRWYSGAGIYRDVWLKVCHTSGRLVSDGSYISIQEKANSAWQLNVRTEVLIPHQARASAAVKGLTVQYRLWDVQTEMCLVTAAAAVAEDGAVKGSACFAKWQMMVRDPVIWDIDNPYRYQVSVCLVSDGSVWQEEDYTVGFRTIAFSPEEGFLLNHRKVKLNGVCEHHDLGCLGAAYASDAMRRKMRILQEMGVNALRLTHNVFAPDVMELADEMGILIVSEAFDMWERPKNSYDYARFFRDWYKKDVASWVRRDRNHPSLIMWSIGNEIFDTHVDERGQEMTRLLKAEVRLHDPDRHAGITIGSNYMPWENAQKCADIVKLAGYNYAEKYYKPHHREHPDWIIYGSETGSVVQSRGVYHFPYRQPVLADMDMQCSALGNATTSWGAKSVESCIIAERDCYFSCGQFVWTGFDYIGEPTPYHTRNSYFGQVDTAGFPKDSYYIYQAAWTDYKKNPMIHVFPYWDFNDGQLIDVRVCSNAPEIELFLNDASQGRYPIDHKNGTQLLGHWQIPYTEGELTACAYDENGQEITRETRKSFREAVQIVLKPDRTILNGNGNDLAFVEISVDDSQGNPVENASNRITVKVSGPGRLTGLDNGDSTDTDEYKTCSRRLFNGKLLAVIAAGCEAGTVVVEAGSEGIAEAAVKLQIQAAAVPEGMGRNAYHAPDHQHRSDMDIPVRAIRLFSPQGTVLNADRQTVEVKAVICPPEASDQEVFWCAVNDAGIPSLLADLETSGTKVKVIAKSDGKFRLRCMSKAGTEQVRVISELDFTVFGFGKAWLDPYGFIAGGLYDYSRGDVSNGNENGIATARDGETQVGFHGIDFGEFGSDEIILPVFALTDEEYPIEIWEGMPGEEGSERVGWMLYQKPTVWNVYQEETCRLSRRLKGITSICFILQAKVHLKGFSFKRLKKAYQQLPITECSEVYGDSFIRTEKSIDQIGNNVTIVFDRMDFGEQGADRLLICGYTPQEKNAVQIRIDSEAGETIQLIEFDHQEAVSEQMFSLQPIQGMVSISFVFLPGSQFDFKWFRFLDINDKE